jgi:hypothetical protein
MLRLPALIAIVASLAMLAGCGGSSDETTFAPAKPGTTAVSAKELRADWERAPACERPRGASRWGCSVDSYRCQGVVTGRGWTVSCAKPGKSVAFRVRPN